MTTTPEPDDATKAAVDTIVADARAQLLDLELDHPTVAHCLANGAIETLASAPLCADHLFANIAEMADAVRRFQAAMAGMHGRTEH